jgi:hypothetical protein
MRMLVPQSKGMPRMAALLAGPGRPGDREGGRQPVEQGGILPPGGDEAGQLPELLAGDGLFCDLLRGHQRWIEGSRLTTSHIFNQLRRQTGVVPLQTGVRPLQTGVGTNLDNDTLIQ